MLRRRKPPPRLQCSPWQAYRQCFVDNAHTDAARVGCLQVHLSVVHAGSGCGRGAVATRAFDKGDVIVKLPARSSVDLGSGAAAEQAYRLLERLQLDPAFKASYAPYLDTLPGPDEVFTPVMYSDEDIAALQCPELVSWLLRARAGCVMGCIQGL